MSHTIVLMWSDSSPVYAVILRTVIAGATCHYLSLLKYVLQDLLHCLYKIYQLCYRKVALQNHSCSPHDACVTLVILCMLHYRVYAMMCFHFIRLENLQSHWRIQCGPTSLTTELTGELTLRQQGLRFGNKQVCTVLFMLLIMKHC